MQLLILVSFVCQVISLRINNALDLLKRCLNVFTIDRNLSVQFVREMLYSVWINCNVKLLPQSQIARPLPPNTVFSVSLNTSSKTTSKSSYSLISTLLWEWTSSMKSSTTTRKIKCIFHQDKSVKKSRSITVLIISTTNNVRHVRMGITWI